MHMQLDDTNMHHVHKILYVLLVRALRTHHHPCINSSIMHMQLDKGKKVNVVNLYSASSQTRL